MQIDDGTSGVEHANHVVSFVGRSPNKDLHSDSSSTTLIIHTMLYTSILTTDLKVTFCFFTPVDHHRNERVRLRCKCTSGGAVVSPPTGSRLRLPGTWKLVQNGKWSRCL